MRVTVKDTRGTVAQDDTTLHDPGDDDEVKAAGRRVCKANGRTFPSSGRIEVDEASGRRWVRVRTLAI